MDNETNATEAEQKKHGALTDSIARMTACLEDVIANAKAALDLSKNMDRDGMKWMTLSKAVFDVHERSRMGWQKLVDPPTAYDPASGTGGGAFFTPKQAIDFIMGNPPFGEVKEVPTPIDPNAPQIAQGEEPWRKIDDTESVGVRYSGNVILAWVVHERTSVTVRAVRIYADGKPSNCWQIVASVDCEKAVIATVFGGRNRAEEVCKKIRNALIAVRLRGRHYRMNVQARKAKAAEEVPNA
jgi:hypothetical protein